MTQSAKCMPCKLKTLRLILKVLSLSLSLSLTHTHTHTELDTVTHACNLKAGKAEKGRSLKLSSLPYLVNSRP